MLSEAEIYEIRAHVQNSYNPRSAAIDALRTVQEHRGYVPDEALEEMAGLIGMTPSELEGVATFYSLIFRRPVGRTVLKVCDSVVCWALGSESLLQHISRRLGIPPGGTTEDGEFTLLRICCLGACDHAPVMMVGDTLVEGVTEEMVDDILAGRAPDREVP